MSINELDDLPTEEEQASVAGQEPTEKKTEEVTVVTDLDSKSKYKEETNEEVLKELPNADVSVKIIEDKVAKTVRLKEVEEMLTNKNMIDQSDANIVQEACGNLFEHFPQKSFTVAPSKVNLAKVKQFINVTIATESEQIATQLNEFTQDHEDNINKSIEALSTQREAFMDEVDNTYHIYEGLYDLVINKGRICFCDESTEQGVKKKIIAIKDQTLSKLQTCYVPPDESNGNVQTYFSQVGQDDLQKMLESINTLAYPDHLRLWNLCSEDKVTTFYSDGSAGAVDVTVEMLANVFYPKDKVDSFNALVEGRAQQLLTDAKAIKDQTAAYGVNGLDMSDDNTIKSYDAHVKMIKSTLEEIALLSRFMSTYLVIYRGLLSVFKLACPDYVEGS